MFPVTHVEEILWVLFLRPHRAELGGSTSLKGKHQSKNRETWYSGLESYGLQLLPELGRRREGSHLGEGVGDCVDFPGS